MYKKSLRIVALALVFSTVVAMSACGGDIGEATEKATEANVTATDENSTTVSETQTTIAAEDTSTAVVTTDKNLVTDVTPSSMPTTNNEIIAYYNTSANNAKKNSKSILSNYELNSQVGNLDLGSSAFSKRLAKLADPLIKNNMGYVEERNNKLYSSQADKNNNFPVEGENWVSKLTTSDIKSAECKESGGVYTITIKLKEDAPSDSINNGDGHAGKAITVIPVQTIYDNAGAAKSLLKNVKVGYSNVKIVAKIDSATGNLKSLNTYMEWTLCLTALGIDVSITFGLEKDYTVNW